MCGDSAEGLELAVGASRAAEDSAISGAGASEFFNVSISADDLAEAECEEALRRARVDSMPMVEMANGNMRRWTEWLGVHRDRLAAHADAVVHEALEIVSRDTYFIGAKLYRALHGLDRFRHHDGDDDDHPVQNDWNGSAKVALLSLERSEAAWHVLADATGDADALGLAAATGILHTIVLDEFLNAMSFIRPGFDDGRIGGSDGSRKS